VTAFAIPGLRACRIDRDWFARHPEWWMLAASAAAWLALILSRQAAPLVPLCTVSGVEPASFSAFGPPLSPRLAAHFGEWCLMTAAMMPPLVVLPVRHVAFRSFRDRRHRAIAEFLAGYLAVWIVAGAVLLPLLVGAGSLAASGRALIAAAGYALAAAWQLTGCKRAALQRCHRTVPLAAEGWRADIACARYGLGAGGSCLASCWAFMTVAMLGWHALPAMAFLEAAALRERYRPWARRRIRSSIPLLGAAFVLDLSGIMA